MKELTDDQIDDIFEGLEHFAPIYMARAAIAADRALNAPADRDVMRRAPDGWKLVPIEPTEEMLREGVMEQHGSATYRAVSRSGCSVFEGEQYANYRAMLAAAPTPPAEQPLDRGSREAAMNERLFAIIASTYQILGALDAPAHILDVLSDPIGATDAQLEAMLPFVPAEQQGEQESASKLLGELLAVIHRDGGHYQAEFGTAKAVADAAQIVSSHSTTLAELRAKVEALSSLTKENWIYVLRNDVLAEIDKLGGKV